MDSGTSTLASSLGAIFLGNIVTATFFGLTTIQTYIYCKCPKDDSFVMQALIFVLWVIDGLHLAFSTHTVYSYTILDYANLKEPQDVVWSLPAMVLVTGMSDLIVRSLFCYRVWKLSKKTSDWSLVVAIILTSIVTVAASWVYAFEAFTVKTLGELSWPVFSQLLYAGLVSALVGDIIIAGSLCILLTSHCTGLSTRTDLVVRIVMLYSVETGVVTCIGVILCLVTYATMPTNYIYIAIYMTLSKLSLNSLLATLNARPSLRAQSGIV